MKRPIRFTLFLVLIGLGLALGFYSWNRPRANANRYQMLSTWGLGRYLAQRYPGNRVLVVSNPFVGQKKTTPAISAQEKSRVEGLIAGLGTHMPTCEVVYPELKPGALENPSALLAELALDSPTTTPLSFLVTSNSFRDLIEAHPETDLVVSLVGIPAELGASPLWQKPAGPHFAFLFPDFRFLGGAAAIRQAVLSGKLAAFVLIKPGVDSEKPGLGKLGQAEFEEHFLLVHDENVEQVLEKWPKLFQQGP